MESNNLYYLQFAYLLLQFTKQKTQLVKIYKRWYEDQFILGFLAIRLSMLDQPIFGILCNLYD